MLENTDNYRLELPPDFNDYEWEVEKKGWIDNVDLSFEGRQYKLSFYDPSRLIQEVKDEIDAHSCFFEPNLIVLRAVNSLNMNAAINRLINTSQIRLLKPE